MASGCGSLALGALLCLLAPHVGAQSPAVVNNQEEFAAALYNDTSEIVVQSPFSITEPILIQGESLTSLIVRP